MRKGLTRFEYPLLVSIYGGKFSSGNSDERVYALTAACPKRKVSFPQGEGELALLALPGNGLRGDNPR